MTSYADDFTLLASDNSIVWAEMRANQPCSSLVRWAVGKQQAIAPQISNVTPFTLDIHQFRLHPQLVIGDGVATLNRTLEQNPGCHAAGSYFIFGPRLCRAVFEGSQRHESHSWIELVLHDRNFSGHLQGHRAPYPQLRCSRLVHQCLQQTSTNLR